MSVWAHCIVMCVSSAYRYTAALTFAGWICKRDGEPLLHMWSDVLWCWSQLLATSISPNLAPLYDTSPHLSTSHLISQSVCLPTYRPSSVLFPGTEGAAVVLSWFPPHPFIWKMWLKERMGLTLANVTVHRFCHCCFFALHLLFLSHVDFVRGGCDERISCFWCNPCRIDSNLPPLMSSRIYYKQMLSGVRLLVLISFLNKGIVLPEEKRCISNF